MRVQKAYLVQTHRFGSNAGEPVEILGVEFATPPGYSSRTCYKVRDKEGKIDHVAIGDGKFYQIISEDDVVAGRIPEVIH